MRISMFVCLVCLAAILVGCSRNTSESEVKDLTLANGLEMVQYLGSETGKVVQVHMLPGTPSGQTIPVIEVEYRNKGIHAAYLSFPQDLKVGDTVLTTKVRHTQATGGSYIRFVSKKM